MNSALVIVSCLSPLDTNFLYYTANEWCFHKHRNKAAILMVFFSVSLFSSGEEFLLKDIAGDTLSVGIKCL